MPMNFKDYVNNPFPSFWPLVLERKLDLSRRIRLGNEEQLIDWHSEI